ncbi:membrane protein insertion efficiency factor YidD, partial [Streptomyces phaeofaciens]
MRASRRTSSVDGSLIGGAGIGLQAVLAVVGVSPHGRPATSTRGCGQRHVVTPEGGDQWTISPLLGPVCKYYPSCSHYGY